MKTAPRSTGPLAISIAVHLLLGIVLINLLYDPYQIGRFLEREGTVAPLPPIERIGFISVPDREEAPTFGRSGGDGEPLAEAPPPPLVAPAAVPSELPPTPADTQATRGGSGPVIGGGGVTQGIRPSYADPRAWVKPGEVATAPKSSKQRLDSAIIARIEEYHDSLSAVGTPRDPGDWTFERNGEKYGIDRQYIRLGKFSIPTAVLALLPLNVQANPTQIERERTLSAMHAEIQEHAQRALNEDEFRAAVKRIRERKDREREAERARLAERSGGARQGEATP